ncbi:helicase-like protein [Melghiribacillus thermohalophilus]|uniref:Helicase-like protein n=1 Tax=Melghiribacillus thermohalophilus TaxID=1324956 RepID=A0A4R3NHJ6_9BACI|nr:SNF2-related protein [Melghiribacillus thermohalophilus]TCT26948.1 helicase-like protein [Melghiribacillus thermohalophilus]
MDIQLQIDRTFPEQLQKRLDQNGPFCAYELFKMAYDTAKHLAIPGFKGLVTPDYLPHMEFLPHQLECARQVVENMNGRAILADEVGLGKTIEAGLILKEYMIRGLAKKVLILVPASLVNQWVSELNEKFYIPAVPQKKSYVFEQFDIVVSSIDTAKRKPYSDIVLNQHYDMVIIDEAHKLRNHKTKNYQFVRKLKKTYCLLLTATPVQNKLTDIFNLVTILKPGYLGSYEEFTEHFGRKKNVLKQEEKLQQLIQNVMVRNRREDTGVNWTKRNIETIWVEFSDEEYEVYLDLEKNVSHTDPFTALTLKREFCSSREACYLSLKKILQKNDHHLKGSIENIIEKIEGLPHHSKAKKVAELIRNSDEKFIVFTEYRASQLYLQWILQQHGISSVPYRGGYKRSKKEWMKQLFQNHAQVLISTEAGGEGINLQFCRNMIHYDLPWNPMRLEQRIGRIHRYGQSKDVHIYYLALKNTLDEQLLSLLYEKLDLFERVIGELDDILERLNIQNLDEEIKEIFARSKSAGEARIKIDNLTAAFHDVTEYPARGGRI